MAKRGRRQNVGKFPIDLEKGLPRLFFIKTYIKTIWQQ